MEEFRSKHEIREWLLTNLKKVEGADPVVFEGDTFHQTHGCRIFFHMHCVFRCERTGEYVWWVFEIPEYDKFPTKRYSTSFDTFLDELVNEYATLWKIENE